MSYRFILFDLDGTLLDTSCGVISAVKKTCRALNLKALDEKTLKSFVGPVMQESFMKHYDMDKQQALKSANLFRELYKESLFKARPYDGILKLLKELKQRGVKLAVATNKSHDNAMKILDKFGILALCDFAMGSDLKGELKKADIVRHCLKELNATKQATCLVGDSETDLNGALSNDIDFLAVLWGFGFKNKDELLNKQCKAVFESVNKLSEFLRSENA